MCVHCTTERKGKTGEAVVTNHFRSACFEAMSESGRQRSGNFNKSYCQRQEHLHRLFILVYQHNCNKGTVALEISIKYTIV